MRYRRKPLKNRSHLMAACPLIWMNSLQPSPSYFQIMAYHTRVYNNEQCICVVKKYINMAMFRFEISGYLVFKDTRRYIKWELIA